MSAEDLKPFLVMKLYYRHERMALLEYIVSQLDTKLFLDIDNGYCFTIVRAHPRAPQPYNLVAGSVYLIGPFP